MTRLLITGGAGFVGHHVIDYFLRNTDWEIVSLDRLDTSGTLNRLADVLYVYPPETHKRLTFVWHDLKAPINSLVENKIGSIDYVFHLAAGSHVDRSIEFPLEFVMDNVVGTCNLLDWARLTQKNNLKLFVGFMTDECFGPAPEGMKYKEWDRYRSSNPYAASKSGAAELCIAFENTYRLPIVNTFTMNVMGIRQHPEKYIPLVMKKVLLGETVFIHSNKERTQAGKRHYINTEDVASALMFLTKNAVSGDKYNIVGERELDNLSLAQMIADIIGKPLYYEMVDFHSSRPGHDLRYALDGSKMASMGWVPEKPIDERLKEVVNWSLNNKYWIGL